MRIRWKAQGAFSSVATDPTPCTQRPSGARHEQPVQGWGGRRLSLRRTTNVSASDGVNWGWVSVPVVLVMAVVHGAKPSPSPRSAATSTASRSTTTRRGMPRAMNPCRWPRRSSSTPFPRTLRSITPSAAAETGLPSRRRPGRRRSLLPTWRPRLAMPSQSRYLPRAGGVACAAVASIQRSTFASSTASGNDPSIRICA